jgi:hypothetical protein
MTGQIADHFTQRKIVAADEFLEGTGGAMSLRTIPLAPRRTASSVWLSSGSAASSTTGTETAFSGQGAQDDQAIEPAHSDLENENLGGIFPDRLEGLLAARACRHDLRIALGCEERLQTLPHASVSVDDHEPDRQAALPAREGHFARMNVTPRRAW